MSIIGTTGPTHSWLYELVFGLDTWLRHLQAVSEYSVDPHCVFRIQIVRIEHGVALSDGTSVRPGDRIIDLHLWNERLPPMSDKGPSIAWALRMRRCVELSLRELARYLAACEELQDIALLRGKIAICIGTESEQMLRLCRQVGFEGGVEQGSEKLTQRIHDFGQIVLFLLMALALNRMAVRRNMLRRKRIVIYLSRRQLSSRFGLTKARRSFVGASRTAS